MVSKDIEMDGRSTQQMNNYYLYLMPSTSNTDITLLICPFPLNLLNTRLHSNLI